MGPGAAGKGGEIRKGREAGQSRTWQGGQSGQGGQGRTGQGKTEQTITPNADRYWVAAKRRAALKRRRCTQHESSPRAQSRGRDLDGRSDDGGARTRRSVTGRKLAHGYGTAMGTAMGMAMGTATCLYPR